jgi:uncharacterized protein YoxC
MGSPGLPGPPSFSSSPWLAVLYYFGFPALMALVLGAALWTVVMSFSPRLDHIEMTLDNRNKEVFDPIMAHQQIIIDNQGKCLDALHQVQNGITGINSQINAQIQDTNAVHAAELRRLDDIFAKMESMSDDVRLWQKPPGG